MDGGHLTSCSVCQVGLDPRPVSDTGSLDCCYFKIKSSSNSFKLQEWQGKNSKPLEKTWVLVYVSRMAHTRNSLLLLFVAKREILVKCLHSMAYHPNPADEGMQAYCLFKR